MFRPDLGRPASTKAGAGLSIFSSERDMRAEIEVLVDEIKQAISLLRRHL
jgi:hypothetical protein